MAPGPIPLDEIVTYWRHVSRVGSIVEFVRIIRAMDGEYLHILREQAK